MSADATIRPIEPADADDYVAVFESVAAEGRWIGTEAPVDAAREDRIRAAATDPPAGSLTNVAVVDGALVGFAHADIDRGRVRLGMAIADGFRGMGIGRRLLTSRGAAWQFPQIDGASVTMPSSRSSRSRRAVTSASAAAN